MSRSHLSCRHGAVLAAGVASLLVLTPSRGAAQGSRQTRENFNAWFNVVGENRLSRQWYLDYDVSLRRSGPLEEMQQLLPRLGVRYQVNPAVRVTWGYAFAETWPYGKLPNTFRFPEHRMWEQLQLNHAVGRVALNHRYRLEQRWLGRVALEDGDEAVQNWVRTNRMRYRLQATLPLQGKTLDDGEFYLQGNNELFINWGANVQFNVFDQNRTILAVGRRFSEKLRAEVGYMEQVVEKSSGRQLERNHTLIFALYPNLSFWHDAREGGK
ncbi:MAG: DUF2490 domain-containing protein [Gemmatimonadaceae bacterium]|nr:DUF2490 domain-containing protein [Gemmatimonadaceae bacterium]